MRALIIALALLCTSAFADQPKQSELERVAKMYAAQVEKGGLSPYDYSMLDKMLELANRVDKGEITQDTMNALVTVHKGRLDAQIQAQQIQTARQQHEAANTAQRAEEQATRDRLMTFFKGWSDINQKRINQLQANKPIECSTTNVGSGQSSTTCR